MSCGFQGAAGVAVQGLLHHGTPSAHTLALGTFGGTPNRDPCSLWGLVWGLPRDIGLYNDYIRFIYGNGIKGPY